jgi:hypothetical protein
MSAEQWFMPLFGMSFLGLWLLVAALFIRCGVGIFRDARSKDETRPLWRAVFSAHSHYSAEMYERFLRDIRSQYFATRLGGLHCIVLAVFFSLTVIFGLCEFIAQADRHYTAKTQSHSTAPNAAI